MLSSEMFEQMQYERDFFAAIAQGDKEIKAGKGIPHEQVFKELFHRLKARDKKKAASCTKSRPRSRS